VFCPEAGWIDFDPTNDQVPTDQHVSLAWGRDYEDVSPVRGIVLGGGHSTLSVAVDVTRVPLAG
jgi:transglutaminase-like putative cysteine protease